MRRSMRPNRESGIMAVAAAVAMLWPSLAGTLARQSGTNAPSRQLVPVAASTLASNPDAYYGVYVTLTAAVEQSLSRLAFSVDQDKTKTTGKDVLVLAPTLQTTVDLNTYVTVIGEVVRFNPAEIAKRTKDYTLDLSPELAEKYRDRPVVLATVVINAAGIDVAKRPPPPITPAEAAHIQMMKQVGPANTALRKAIEGTDVALTRESAAVLRKALSETQAFWKAEAKIDATQWAQEARTLIESIDRSAAGGSWDQVKTSASTLNQTCQNCHNAYRERLEDGTYRIKRGTIP